MYGKSFAQQFTGSMMGAGPSRFALWNYCIANSDKDGLVEINPHLAAALIGDTIGNVEDALAFLLSPDPRSRSKDEEGRRLAHEGEFFYRIVNFKKYKEIRSADDRRAYMREYMRKRRAGGVNKANESLQLAQLAHAYSCSNSDAVPPPPPARVREDVPESLEAAIAYAKAEALPNPEAVATAWHRHYTTQGWVLGNGLPMASWRSSLKSWAFDDARKNSKPNSHAAHQANPQRPKGAVWSGSANDPSIFDGL